MKKKKKKARKFQSAPPRAWTTVQFLDDYSWYPAGVQDTLMRFLLYRPPTKKKKLDYKYLPDDPDHTKERRKTPFPCDRCGKEIPSKKWAYLGVRYPFTILCKKCYTKGE